MLSERYSVEASDGCVLIYGYLHIDELISLMQVYVEQGYQYVYPGHENSSLCLTKNPFHSERERIVKKEFIKECNGCC